MNYPSYLNNLIESLASLPGIGPKSATRMAFDILKMDQEKVAAISTSLNNINNSVKYCRCCHSLAENDLCELCLDEQRNQNVICVVSNYKDVFNIERMQSYDGVYHVLGGDIAINRGITPDKLNINSLLLRINDDIQEVILATNPTIEGETTALYIQKLLEDKNISVTRIAYGLPIGANLEIIDQLTMSKAFENRK